MLFESACETKTVQQNINMLECIIVSKDNIKCNAYCMTDVAILCNMYVHVCMCVYMPACLPACVRACMHAWMYVCMYVCMYV